MNQGNGKGAGEGDRQEGTFQNRTALHVAEQFEGKKVRTTGFFLSLEPRKGARGGRVRVHVIHPFLQGPSAPDPRCGSR